MYLNVTHATHAYLIKWHRYRSINYLSIILWITILKTFMCRKWHFCQQYTTICKWILKPCLHEELNLNAWMRCTICVCSYSCDRNNDHTIILLETVWIGKRIDFHKDISKSIFATFSSYDGVMKGIWSMNYPVRTLQSLVKMTSCHLLNTKSLPIPVINHNQL